MVTYNMRTSADANSTDAYLPKTTEEKAGAVGGVNAAVPTDPNPVFASVITLQAWQPYPTGGGGSGAISTTQPVETDATLSVPNLDGGGGGGGGATPATITQDGLVASFSNAGTVGQYADGSYWVVAPAGGVVLASVAIAVGEVANLYVGGVMVDPSDMSLQGFDSRTSGGLGPGIAYSAAKAVTLPATIDHYPDGSPKTIWCYRGRDVVEGGGAYSGCWAMMEITVVSSAKSSAHIKPTGIYVAGGKPEYTTADINYSLFTPVAIPGGAGTEPDWDTLANMYFVRPFVRWGRHFVANGIGPTMYQDAYPGNQGMLFGKMLLGAISTSANRNKLINRIVRDGLMVHSQVALAAGCFSAGGGFGAGGARFMRFFAGKFLNVPAMLADAGTTTDPSFSLTGVEFFQEDDNGCVYTGSSRVLYGTKQNLTWPALPFPANHDLRDPAGLVEPHMFALDAGTAQAGGASTITLKAGTSVTVSNFDRIYIVSGPGAGALKWITAYNSSTKVATMDSAWSVQPTSASTYEVYNGGGYQIIASQRVSGASAAVVLAGLTADWASDNWLTYIYRFVETDNGYITPRYPTDPSWQVASARIRRHFDTTPWTEAFWNAAAPIWPGVGGGGVTFVPVAFNGDHLNRGGQLTGVVDGEEFTFVCRCQIGSAGAGTNRYFVNDAQDNFKIALNIVDQLQCYMYQGANQRIGFTTNMQFLNADGMVTIFIAGRSTSGSEVLQVYKDNTAATFASYAHVPGPMDLTATDWLFFANSAGALKLDASVEFVWFDNKYYDVSNSTVRDKWLPANIGANGSGPGVQPKVFKYGPAADWNASPVINLGTGANLAMNGAVT